MSEDPLSALIIDGDELDKERIVAALKGKVGIGKSGNVVHLPAFSELSASQKILATLLAFKAAEILELRSDATAGPTELAKATGITEGTVFPTMRRLNSDRLVSQDAQTSRYFVAHHQVGAAASEVDRSNSGTSRPATRPKKAKPSKRRPSPAASQVTPQVRRPSADGSRANSDEVAAHRPNASKARPSATGYSPMSAIRTMIQEGFFDQAKGIGDVRNHLKDVHARDVPVTTLSPTFTRLLRSQELRRRKKDDGKYEYFSSGGQR